MLKWSINPPIVARQTLAVVTAKIKLVQRDEVAVGCCGTRRVDRERGRRNSDDGTAGTRCYDALRGNARLGEPGAG